MFFIIIFAILFLLQYLAFRTFRNFVKEKFDDRNPWRSISIYPFIIFNLLFLFIIFFRSEMDRIPQFIFNIIFIPFYIFIASVIFIGLYLLIGKLIKMPFIISYKILNLFGGIRNWFKTISRKPEIKKIDNSRRAFLRTSALFVSGYAFTGASLGVLRYDDYSVENVDIALRDLPDELDGTTISLICDVHSGPFMKEDLMREYVDAVNDLKSDLILIPGDLTNSIKEEVLPFANAFKNLKAKAGIFASLGNHDYFSDPDYIAKIVNGETPIKLLRNKAEIVEIRGQKIVMLGVEDTRKSGATYDEMLMSNLDQTVEAARRKSVESNLEYESLKKIALFHKPYFFDSMIDENLDLIVSGHTHGGQVVLAKFGNTNISFAGAISKYISGLYKNGNSNMYVSRGIGSVALPIRMNCPPEITKITLRKKV